MIAETLLSQLPVALAAIAAGLAIGLGYFRMLQRSVDALGRGAGWRKALLPGTARFTAAALLFVLAAHFGAVALLAAFAGFLLARRFALRRARKAA